MEAIKGAGDVQLVTPGDDPSGSLLAIAMRVDEPGAAWRLNVDVTLRTGSRFRLGSIMVRSNEGTFAPRSRIVAQAFCPGVARWFVRAMCTSRPGEGASIGDGRALIDLSATREGGGSAARVGVWSVDATADDLADAPMDDGAAFYGRGEALPPGWFYEVAGTNEGPSRTFVQLFNGAAEPTPGTAPLRSIGVSPLQPYRLAVSGGIALERGVSIWCSTNPAAYAPDAGALVLMNVQARAVAPER